VKRHIQGKYTFNEMEKSGKLKAIPLLLLLLLSLELVSLSLSLSLSSKFLKSSEFFIFLFHDRLIVVSICAMLFKN